MIEIILFGGLVLLMIAGCFYSARIPRSEMTESRETCCNKCGNADNFEWEEIQKNKPWLIKCSTCGHSWIEGED